MSSLRIRLNKGEKTRESEHSEDNAINCFFNDLDKCEKETVRSHESGTGMSEEEFVHCVFMAMDVQYRASKPKGMSKCSKVLKTMWLCWLIFLAFCLLAAGYQPVSFHVHKAIHTRLYYVLRPVRLGMVKILPYLKMISMDFLDTDCMLENPLLNDTETCPCFKIKHTQEIFLNDSFLPPYVKNVDVFNILVLRNVTKFTSNFSIETFSNFPSLNNGNFPWACSEMSIEDRGIYKYEEFFDENKMNMLIHNGKTWSFSWEECPDHDNPLTLHTLIPPLHSSLNSASTSIFTVGTKWSRFTHYPDTFLSGAVVIIRILLGEIRFVMEPKNEECQDICSPFKENPILKQGDALLFDQRVWNFMAFSWSELYFVTIQFIF